MKRVLADLFTHSFGLLSGCLTNLHIIEILVNLEHGYCYGSIYSKRAPIGIANNTQFILFASLCLIWLVLKMNVCVCVFAHVHVMCCAVLSGNPHICFYFYPQSRDCPTLHRPLGTAPIYPAAMFFFLGGSNLNVSFVLRSLFVVSSCFFSSSALSATISHLANYVRKL